jgi:hypothetical protein
MWKTPNAPGRAPATTDGTAAQLSTAHHVWEKDVQTYRTCTSVKQALKKQIIGVFKPMYLEILNDNMVGYANISARDMLDHHSSRLGDQLRAHAPSLGSPAVSGDPRQANS